MRNRNMSVSAASAVPARNSWSAVLKDESNVTGADELSILGPAPITETLPEHTENTRGRTGYKVSNSEESYLVDHESSLYKRRWMRAAMRERY